jgi:hypothetical protein
LNCAEAATIEFDEPEWRERFEAHCARWPRLPRYLQEDAAFEATLADWRRFHSTPAGDKRRPASAVDGIVVLAKLGIMPPRSAWVDIPHGDAVEGYQHDDHCWMSYAGEQWRIAAIEDRILHLERMTFEGVEREKKQIDLNRAKWTSYVEAAAAVLAAMG